MRNFVILLLVIFIGLSIAENSFANTLYGLYSDNSLQRTPPTSAVRNVRAKKKSVTNKEDKTQYNNRYMPDYYSESYKKNSIGSTSTLMKQGSKNYGQYGKVMNRTNPIRIDNPYNYLNDSYMKPNPSQSVVSKTNYNGDAVKFKRGKNGEIYGYNKFGKKVGVYRVNNNGTTTQFDTRGNNMGTFK